MKQTQNPAPQRAITNADIATPAAITSTAATPATTPRRLPYTPPLADVVTVRTEAGYALSGVPSPWDPVGW